MSCTYKPNAKRRNAVFKAWHTRKGPYFHIAWKSENKKTGNMIVTTSSQVTCPDACPFKKNGCYADSGPLLFHWNNVTRGNRGLSFDEFLEQLRSIER